MSSYRTRYLKVPYRERRKDRRVLFPSLVILVEDARYTTRNWSFGGFLIEGCPGAGYLCEGDVVSGSIGWDEVAFPFRGIVRRAGGDAQELAVSFDDIAESALDFLDRRLSAYLAASVPKD